MNAITLRDVHNSSHFIVLLVFYEIFVICIMLYGIELEKSYKILKEEQFFGSRRQDDRCFIFVSFN